MKSAAFYTLGCKVNQYETEAIAEQFAERGYDIKDFSEFADVYVINTCSVTAMSDRKSRQIIRRAKKQNPHSVVIVTGCYAQVAPEAVLKIEGVNLVIGTNEKNKIVSEAEKLTETAKEACVHNIAHTHDFEEMTGVSQGLACQTVVHVDGAVYIGVEDSEEEITVPMDIFED